MASEVHKAHVEWLRGRRARAGRVDNIELFFDLVYVLAVTQLTHHLLNDLTLRGAAETILLLLVVWFGWINTVWITNYFDLAILPVRFMLIGVMLASLVMSASIPNAFGAQGLTFALGATAVGLGGTGFLRLAVGRHHPLSRVMERVLIWWIIFGALFFGGALVEDELRFALWAAAVALAFFAVWSGFPVPRFGHNETTEYTIRPEPFAERFHLFIILALGESILIAGANFSKVVESLDTVATFLISFIGSVTLWWIYFDRGAEAGVEVIRSSADPGRLGIIAYTFFHIPLVAGIIIVAAGDEMVLAHPRDPVSLAAACLILGGLALFLLGNVLYKQTLWGHIPRSRYVAFFLFALLIPVAFVAPALVLLTAVNAVLVFVAWWDTRTHRLLDESEETAVVSV